MSVIWLIVLIAFVVGLVIAYRAGASRASGEARGESTASPPSVERRTAEVAAPAPAQNLASPLREHVAPEDPNVSRADVGSEKARIIVAYEGEAAWLRHELGGAQLATTAAAQLADNHSELTRALDEARAETARYRQLLIDLENNSPPPLLDSPNAPDDLKLIVGVGPVLERMLQQLGISTYRQIARWSERDIDEFDGRLVEFPGRIRRDGWVTQARALHQSKYGVALPPRERA